MGDQKEAVIKSERCGIIKPGTSQEGVVRKKLLSGEIIGLDTCYIELSGNQNATFQPEENRLRILLFTDGSGGIRHEDSNFSIDEIALFIPQIDREFHLSSGSGNLGFLEIMMSLVEKDQEYLEKRGSLFPYFIRYSQCTTYSELIKSPETVNRTLLPEEIVPRLCIGSVMTNGPDKVAAHAHPMLEQLFYGLQGNDIEVFADEAKKGFKENDLLHIPSGSLHGATVEAGKELHYIWIDLFNSMEDIDYIKTHHIQEEP